MIPRHRCGQVPGDRCEAPRSFRPGGKLQQRHATHDIDFIAKATLLRAAPRWKLRRMADRIARGRTAYASGVAAEAVACRALAADGWAVLARRLRTAAGEIDIVAERDGLLALVEVKARPTLSDAAASVSPRQQKRLLAAAGIILADNPGWGGNGIRFDVIVVDAGGQVRRVADAFRQENL